MEPFWERAYLDDEVETFGKPSEEVINVSKHLNKNSKILDLGCGDGRHAIYLARLGHIVDAIDISKAGIDKINRIKEKLNLTNLKGFIGDATNYEFNCTYDLIISHGLFHFIERNNWANIIHRMKTGTQKGGYNIVTVFTDEVEIPEDLKPYVKGIFHEGELKKLYFDWSIEMHRSYQFEDEHDNNIRHCHAVNKIVARKI
ncbi:methyltransferase domain-containing protein [Cytobacillus sp.]|uniref:methyltransferase domain-containing protein n=1 Tax=Cytobacillus sp. TaxID=2675269 RepID=UPI0028BD7003|nr:methyltransferase domain-containing protein [Cytobacillus sp.]